MILRAQSRPARSVSDGQRAAPLGSAEGEASGLRPAHRPAGRFAAIPRDLRGLIVSNWTWEPDVIHPVRTSSKGRCAQKTPCSITCPCVSLALPRPAAADEQTHQGKRTPGRREEEAAASGSAEKRLFPHLPMHSKQHPRAAASGLHLPKLIPVRHVTGAQEIAAHPPVRRHWHSRSS